MEMREITQIPENHPLKKLFRTLADRAMSQSSLPDRDLLHYLSNLLLDFIYVENLYRIKDEDGRPLHYLVDMLEQASGAPSHQKKQYYQQIGDYSLFMLGMFPESLTYGRRMLSRSFYSDTGRRSYLAASEFERRSEETVVFRKLADKFERCVSSLQWVREYTSDPFYQYMMRQFDVT